MQFRSERTRAAATAARGSVAGVKLLNHDLLFCIVLAERANKKTLYSILGEKNVEKLKPHTRYVN